jgi:hypothetical protein
MEKIKWIEIKNFRGIKYCRLERFGDINVFIGRNNTGKSTVLEGIYLCLVKNGLPFFFPLNMELMRSEYESVCLKHAWDLIHLKRREKRYNRYWCYNGEVCEIEISTNLSTFKFKPTFYTQDIALKVPVVYIFPSLSLYPRFSKVVRNCVRESGATAIKKVVEFYRKKAGMRDLEYIESL